MNCQQATRLLSDAQERRLSLKERAALKVHVIMCSGCRNFGEQMGVLRNISHTYAKGSEANVGETDGLDKNTNEPKE